LGPIDIVLILLEDSGVHEVPILHEDSGVYDVREEGPSTEKPDEGAINEIEGL
jgi:hypothetical protein